MFDIKIYYSSFNVNSTRDILFWPSKYISINEQIFMYPIYTKKDKCVDSIENFLKCKNDENLNLIKLNCDEIKNKNIKILEKIK